ncbi:MAG: PAS domain-containing protein [Pseudomonadales bacterium]
MSHEDPPLLPELIVSQSPDAIIFADPDGLIRVWNTAAEQIFGFTAEEAIEQNLDIIIPERFREAHWKGYDLALANGRTKHGSRALPTRAQRADGESIVVELTFSVIVDPDGKALGALANAREISNRFEKEKADRKRLRELESELQKLSGAPRDV